MELSAIAKLIADNGWPAGIALLTIAGCVWLCWGLRKATIAVWEYLKPLIGDTFKRHMDFIDATAANLQKQAEAITTLTEKIEQMGIGTKIDAIHEGVQTIVNRGCGQPSQAGQSQSIKTVQPITNPPGH